MQGRALLWNKTRAQRVLIATVLPSGPCMGIQDEEKTDENGKS